MMSLRKLFLSLCLLSVCYFSSAATWAAKNLTAAGCKTEYFLIKDLVAPYRAKTGVTIEPLPTGNLQSITMLLTDQASFTFNCQPITKLARKLNLSASDIRGWKNVTIAKDPIVIIAHPGTGVSNLSLAQLTDIFSGKITNWKAVGGEDLPIQPAYLSSSLASGVVLLFKEFTVGAKHLLTKDATKLDSPEQLGKYISEVPGSISFMSQQTYQKSYGKQILINSVAPTTKNILNGNYPLAATYYLLIKDNDADAKNFADFVTSPEGQAIVAKQFTPFTTQK